MDPRSTSGSLSPAGSLERLAERGGTTFPHLLAARELADRRIAEARASFALIAPPDVSVTLFGSFARRELTEGSDNDWAILTPTGRVKAPDVLELAAVCRERFNEDDKAPGSQDLFGLPFAWPRLAQYVGLDADSNTNLTRRMLTLLESVPITGHARDDCWRAIFDRYMKRGVRDHRPPRFLLNDTIRYWRTICVDFEGKHAETGGSDSKWVMRNAKLRTSRTMLFAGGLLPVLFCRLREQDEIPVFLEQQFAAPPVDRVAWAFLELGMEDEGGRCLSAYDEWVAMLQDDAVRDAIGELRADSRDASPVFQQVRDIGRRLQSGLVALLFNSDLAPASRTFLVF
jgi:predicted nucleotidyltransferase